MRSWLRARLPLAWALFGAMCLTGPQWGGSYTGAELVDATIVLLVSLARCMLAAALWVRALDPAKLSVRNIMPLALVWLLTSQLVASLGEFMPLAAELFAGEPWLEAIYPHGQLIYMGFSLLGWMLTLLTGALWYRRRGGRFPGRLLGRSLAGFVLWGFVLWGLRTAADALAVSDTCGIALVLDTLELAGPALMLAHWVRGVEPLSDSGNDWQILSMLWAPALWFFTQYGFALRMLEAMADYGIIRAYWLMPLDLLGDLALIGALWVFAALCASCAGKIPVTGKNILRCAPAAVIAAAFCLGHSTAIFPLQEAMVASEYQVLPCLGWAGVSLLWQTSGLVLSILFACLMLRMRPLPWVRLLLAVPVLVLVELLILLASYGLAIHPAGYSFGLSLAVELPYAELIGFHALILVAIIIPQRKKQGDA